MITTSKNIAPAHPGFTFDFVKATPFFQYIPIYIFLYYWPCKNLSYFLLSSNRPNPIVHIVFSVTPFKIIGSVIRFVLINVIYLAISIWVWNKHLRYKAMNKDSLCCPICTFIFFVKRYIQISPAFALG